MPYGREAGNGPDEASRYFTMQGQPVYRQAVEMMAKVSTQVLEKGGCPASAVDWLVCHQANQRIMSAVAARLGLPGSRCFSNIAKVGNTAAASIPLALAQGAQSGMFSPGHRVVLTGFGGGLTWGATMFRWPDLVSES
jgi:3-oxoacyl-[acyl-carrier-protein] synthase-3